LSRWWRFARSSLGAGAAAARLARRIEHDRRLVGVGQLLGRHDLRAHLLGAAVVLGN
jgi:hypothetical protein